MTKRNTSKSTDRNVVNEPPRILSLRINRIEVGANRREHDDDAVKNMAVSMRDIGLLNPINVISTGKNDEGKNGYALVAGFSRLKAAERLGWKRINATVLEGDDYRIRLLEIAENLFRDELTVLERSELITEWGAIVSRRGAHGDHRGGKQPHDRGISKTARKLKLSRAMIGRSETIAALSDDAKSAAKTAGLANSTRYLLEIAKQKTDADQLDKIEEIRSRKESRKGQKRKKARQKDPEATEEVEELSDIDSPSLFDNENDDANDERSTTGEDSADADLQRLKMAWLNASACVKAWSAASPATRERFVKEVLGYSIKAATSEAEEH